jgi:hypothetical protein
VNFQVVLTRLLILIGFFKRPIVVNIHLININGLKDVLNLIKFLKRKKEVPVHNSGKSISKGKNEYCKK